MPATARPDLVVVTDALPVHPTQDPTGRVHWRATHGGADAALLPVVARRRGTWVGWHGLDNRLLGTFEWDRISLHPVPLAVADVEEHLGGHCETTLAPLYHDNAEAPRFDRRWRQAYRRVNDRYSRAAAAVAAPGATVWVHDLQLQLVPAMLRVLRPDLQIGFFLHAPFPPVELFEKLPQRREILGGLLGADLVGFQNQRSAANFCQAVTEFGDYRMDSGLVHPDGRQIAVGTFPLSVDTADLERRAREPYTRLRATQIRAELNLPRTVLLAVDRLEPADGIEERLTAYQELLNEGRVDPASTVLVQIALPSRRHRPDRPDVWTRIERKVAEINGLHSQLTRPAVHFLNQPLEPQELVAFYLAADVMLATPLRSGMNLRAKEYLSCRTDGTGTLVLSEGSGTAAAFPEAITVNPYDLDALKFAILAAVEPANPDIHRVGLQAMRLRLREHDVHRWAASYLDALSDTMAPPGQTRPTGPLPAPRHPRDAAQVR